MVFQEQDLRKLVTNIRKVISFIEDTKDIQKYQICFGRLIWIDVQSYLDDFACEAKGQLKRDESIDGDDFKVVKISTNELICQGSCGKMLQLSENDFENIDDYNNIR